MDEKTLTFTLEVEIPASHELRLILPRDLPVGPARISITSNIERSNQQNTLGALLRSEFFGMWGDRAEIVDSVKFARQLRRRAWSRTK